MIKKLSISSDNKIIFISDLHLKESDIKSFYLFEKYMLSWSKEKAIVFILGDFWDYWVSDREQSPFISKVKNILMEFTKKSSLYFMVGNRDFILSNKFAKQTKIQYLNDPCILYYNSKKIYLMHGDLLCTNDVSYQKFRKIIRNKLVRFAYSLLPLFYKLSLVRKAREKSKESQRVIYSENSKILDITQEGMDKYLTGVNNQDILVHGHTHENALHDEIVNGSMIKRFVLGDWHEGHGSCILLDKNGINLFDIRI